MKKLEESDIIRIMREEWDAKVARLSEEVDVVLKGKVDGGPEKTLISPDLKVRSKGKKNKKGFLYTVVSVGKKDVVLKTPEGDLILVNNEELEKNYELG